MWRELEGYAHRYRISDKGVVQVRVGNGWRTKIQQHSAGQHSSTVYIMTNEGMKRKTVGSLMAAAFWEGTPPGYMVIHRNGLLDDNRLKNLRLVPKKGTPTQGPRWTKKTVIVYDRHGEIVNIYPSIAEAARREGVSSTAMSRYCHGPRWYVCQKTNRSYGFEEDD